MPQSLPRTGVLLLLLAAGQALGQDGAAAPSPAPERGAATPASTSLPTRRPASGEPTVLAFNKTRVDKLISFIAQATHMVVMPQPDVMNREITVINDQAIPQEQALDLVFLALHQAGVAVVESGGVITLRDITEVDRQDVPVIGPTESVLTRGDLGMMAEKVYALNNSTAEKMGELLKDAIPKYAKLSVDTESNQVAVMGNIALLQRMERLITSLDRPSSAALASETFRLRYADAEQIKTNIEELFSAENGGAAGRNRNQGGNNNRGNGPQFFGGPGGGQNQNQRNQNGASPGGATASENLRVTANTQQNSVTVVGEPTILSEVRDLIDKSWDLPLAPEAVVPKIYDLENTDPIKMRDLLQQTFGQPEGVTGGGGGGGGNNANRNTGSSSSQGVGRLAGQFSFQAMPESGRLLVVAKSPDNMAVIDEIIKELDKPQTVGLPAIVELKHASAEELAEQLNTLLSQEGTLAQIPRAESGLSEGGSNESPFATQETTTDDQGNTTQDTTSSDIMTFWWQRARPPTDSRGSSNLVSKVRLVPVWRQNAVMVLAPPEYKNSIIALIEQLDQPGRQVLISAIVAEIARDDATSLGLRWSSSAITPANSPDNSISIGSGARGTENNPFGNLFDTSVLNMNANLNVLIQALAQKTAVNILSEPKIFTSDNQEAEFFDGQDIPFVTDSQTNDQGNVTHSFDYRAVGIQLRARPRITPDRKVDLRVNLELSSIIPGQTLFGGFIVDRRETTTQVIVKNGQTIVISGILRSEDSNTLRKVPILGDIPLLGVIFRSRDKTIKETELIVFITPVVVDNVDDVDSVTQPLRGPLDTLRERFHWDEKNRGEARDLRDPK